MVLTLMHINNGCKFITLFKQLEKPYLCVNLNLNAVSWVGTSSRVMKEKIKALKIPRKYADTPVLFHIGGISPSIETEEDFFYSLGFNIISL